MTLRLPVPLGRQLALAPRPRSALRHQSRRISTSSCTPDRHTHRTTPAHASKLTERTAGHTDEQIRKLASFIRSCEGKVTVITGAGVSTLSNIPDYRGPNGAYVRNKDYKPIQYQEFMGAHYNRQRYWARSMLGYGTVYNAQPNIIHLLLAQWQLAGRIGGIITQNVDSLHLKAGAKQCLELHGTLATVECQSCTHVVPRADFQGTLARLNPAWAAHVPRTPDGLAASERLKSVIPPSHKSPGEARRARPDGDTETPAALDFASFTYPSCPCCATGVLKPGVVFFGENIAPGVKDLASAWVRDARGVLVLGTTLTTYSAYRLVKDAVERGVGVWCVNEGKTRADGMWTGGKVQGKVQDVLVQVEHLLRK